MKAVFLVGASGAGKTSLSQALSEQYTRYFGGQDVVTVNLDCANPEANTDIDICQLITLEDIMEEYHLGPNGAILYAADFLLANVDWLLDQIEAKAVQRNPSLSLPRSKSKVQLDLDPSVTLFVDLPGQMQLYLQSESMLQIVGALKKRLKLRCCLLELFDATYIYEINDFVSMCMIALTTGINFEMPQINLIHKIDLLKNRQPGHGMLEEYFKVTSLREMGKDLRMEQAPLLEKIEEVIDQYGRVSFAPCSVQMPDLILHLIFNLEKMLGTLENNLYGNRVFAQAMKQFLKDFASERLINDLQAELFGEDNTDWEADMAEIAAMEAQRKREV